MWYLSMTTSSGGPPPGLARPSPLPRPAAAAAAAATAAGSRRRCGWGGPQAWCLELGRPAVRARERAAAADSFLFSQGCPLFLCRIPTPALAGPRGMGAGEVELAGQGQDGWSRRRARLLESEEAPKPSRFAPTPTLGPRDVGPGGVGKFGKVETAEQTEKIEKFPVFFPGAPGS